MQCYVVERVRAADPHVNGNPGHSPGPCRCLPEPPRRSLQAARPGGTRSCDRPGRIRRLGSWLEAQHPGGEDAAREAYRAYACRLARPGSPRCIPIRRRHRARPGLWGDRRIIACACESLVEDISPFCRPEEVSAFWTTADGHQELLAAIPPLKPPTGSSWITSTGCWQRRDSPRPANRANIAQGAFGQAIPDMASLPVMPSESNQPHRRLPAWLKRPLPIGGEMAVTRRVVAASGVATVCEEARCPNLTECWSHKTATFMILGDKCTRRVPITAPCTRPAPTRPNPMSRSVSPGQSRSWACATWSSPQ